MLSNETKIGLLTIVSLALLIWGYKYLKGKNILSSSTFLYVEYEDVDQLTISTPVLRNGFQVGIVGDIYFKEDMSTLEVVLDLKDDVRIPKNAVAEIMSTGFMGGRAVNLSFDLPCKAGNCAQSGDYLKGRTKNLMSSMVGDPKDLKGYMDVLGDNMGSIVDTIKNNLSDPGGKPNESVESVKKIIANLESTTNDLNAMIRMSKGKIAGLMDNAASITANLEANNQRINDILTNANTMTSNFAKLDMSGTLNKANAAMDGASGTMASLEKTLGGADEAVKNLTLLLNKMNNGEGTLGLLMNDKTLYNDLDHTLKNMDFLLQDLRLHPERYRRVLSKKKMPYEKADVDPAFGN